eukprot:TRINITY_DN30513_c0_g1_i1.p1 TRINITY_DN30513_c0_g1~~TRINITY_DN30513_c0_g1_i1.p1  ORF type:complete len:714 (+),score=207.31 TRINITY_DN30513_c0_g1_i1:77-2218(+)
MPVDARREVARVAVCVGVAGIVARRKEGADGKVKVRWIEAAALLFAGSVFAPALPSLWRHSVRGGKTAALAVAAMILVLRVRPDVRRAHHKLAEAGVPALCAVGLALSAVLRVADRGKAATTVLRSVATVAAPGVLLEGIESPGTCDVIALVGASLSVLLGQDAAAVLLLLMVTGGEALEEKVVQRAGECVSKLIDQQRPKQATVVDSALSLDERAVPVESVQPGDILVLREGDMVPCDAQVIQGSGTYDESVVTGEAVPTSHSPQGGSPAGASQAPVLMSGTIVVSAERRVLARVERAASNSTLALLAEALQAALERSAQMEQTTRMAAELFPAATFAAAAASFAWRARKPFDQWQAVLAILSAATTCPLAIGVPVAFLSGISVAARSGITVKSGAALEKLGRATMVVFDKTGTLTSGVPKVRRVSSMHLPETELVAIAAAAEQASGHVLARAVRTCCERRGVRPRDVRDGSIENMPGQGVSAEVRFGSGWERVLVGSPTLLAGAHVEVPASALLPEMAVHVAVGQSYAGTLYFDDPLRQHAVEAVRRLRSHSPKLRLAILSGDRSGRLQRVAEEVGINTVRCCFPHEKAEAIDGWRREGHCVVMIGDGVNDAAALAMADVGVSVGTNALASESADIVLVQQDLLLLEHALRLGKQVVRTARRGVVYGMGASFTQMALAELGVLTPLANSFLQEVVDLSAILNSASVLLTGK